jgi:hypothetical protein
MWTQHFRVLLTCNMGRWISQQDHQRTFSKLLYLDKHTHTHTRLITLTCRTSSSATVSTHTVKPMLARLLPLKAAKLWKPNDTIKIGVCTTTCANAQFTSGRVGKLSTWGNPVNDRDFKYCNGSVGGRDSSVGIATRYGLEGTVIGRADFPHSSRPALWPTQPPTMQWVLGLEPGVKAAEAKGIVGLYRYFPSGPSCPVHTCGERMEVGWKRGSCANK